MVHTQQAVTHPSGNRTQCRLTTLIGANAQTSTLRRLLSVLSTVPHPCCSRIGDYSTNIPSQCCALPYTLNGELFYNCTVNPAFSNDLGCYHSNRRWVTCQQPAGM